MINKDSNNKMSLKPNQIPNTPQYPVSTCLQIESSQLSLTSQSNPFQLSVSPFKEDLLKSFNPASDQCSKSILNNSIQSFQISRSHSEFIENILTDSQANHIDSIQSNDLKISSNSIVFEKKNGINSSLTICNYYNHSNNVTPKIIKSHSDSNNLSLASDNNILSSKKNFLYDKKTPIKYTKSQLKKTDRTISKKNIKESTENEEAKNMNDTSLIKGKKNLKDTFEKMIKEDHSRQITEIYTKGINDLFMGTNEYHSTTNTNAQEQLNVIHPIKKKECLTIKTKSTRNNSSSSSNNKHIDINKRNLHSTTNKNSSKMTLKMNTLNNTHNNHINSRTINTPRCIANQPKKNFYHLKNFATNFKNIRPISQNNTSRTRNKYHHQSKDAISNASNKNNKGFISKEKENKQTNDIMKKKLEIPLKDNSVKKNGNRNISLHKKYNNTNGFIKNKALLYKTERINYNAIDKKLIQYDSHKSNSLKTKAKINNNNNHHHHQIQSQKLINNTSHHYQFKPRIKNNSKQKETKKKESISQLLVKLYNTEMNKANHLLPSSKDKIAIPTININLLKTSEENQKTQSKHTSFSPKVIQNFSRYHILKQKRDESTHGKRSTINLDNSILNNYPTYDKPPILFTKINQVFGDSDSELIIEID